MPRLGKVSSLKRPARGKGGSAKKAGAKPASARSSKAKAKAKSEATTKSSAATKTEPATKPRAAAARPGKKAPAPNMQERMEGLQGWMAEIERKQSRMSRLGGAGVILAVLAAAGALALGVLNKQDAATKDDVDELREEVNALSGEIEKQTEKQLGTLNQQVKGFASQIAALEAQQKQQAATISSLQSRVNSAANAPSPAVTPGPGAARP